MKQVFIKILVSTAIASSTLLWAGEYDDGMRAWDRQDYRLAKEKFLIAAEQGNAGAQIRLGFISYYGLDTTIKNYTQALSWFKKAAENNNTDAQFLVGAMYLKAEGVVKDYKQVMYWHTKAAELGNAEAQTSVGRMYRDGLGVEQNNKQAVYWFIKAANQGEVDAQKSLGVMYLRGDGLVQDNQQALSWFSKAAEQGDAEGQYRYGLMYLLGRGVTPNVVIGHMWLNLAASNGDTKAYKARDDLAKSAMTGQQIEQAQQMAKRCQMQKYKNCDKLN